MTDLPVLRSRQAGTVERRAPQGPSDALIEKAKMLAASGDMLPKHYADKPGACMALLDWCDRNDVSILEGIADVSIIRGKPVVSAELQMRLAGRSGYSTRQVAADETSATVAVYGPDGAELGQSTYTIEMAGDYGLLAKSRKSAERGGTDFWKTDPRWMLIKRATTRALAEWTSGQVALFADERREEPDEGVDVLPAVEAKPGDAVVAIDLAGNDPLQTEADIKAVLKEAKVRQVDALQWAQGEFGAATLAEVAANPEHVATMLDWVNSQ
jgi:hypothetical protein